MEVHVNMSKKLMRVLGMALAVIMALSIIPMASFAASPKVDSIASVNQTDDGKTVGVDATQSKVTEYVDNITEDGTHTVDVYATQASTFSLKLPKQVILDGAYAADKTYSGAYQISATGNIAGDEQLTVVNDASFALQQAGKEDITATVTQAKNTFRNTTDTVGATVVNGLNLDTPVTIDGTVSAQGITAGSWSGNFNIAVALTEIAP